VPCAIAKLCTVLQAMTVAAIILRFIIARRPCA
jgi:hypothetical protein